MNVSSPIVPRDAVPLDSLRRVLVIKLRHHGDVLLTAPVFASLRAARPALEVDALVYADTAPMLTGHPDIERVWTIDRQWKRLGLLGQARAELGLLRDLRARHYDLVVHLTEHPRGAWLTRLLGPRWSVAPKLPGRGRFWRRSFSHFFPTPVGAARHTVERNLDALRRLGIQPAPASRQVTLVPGAAADGRVATLLQEAGLTPGGFIHLHPASRWHFKCWPESSLAAIVGRLAAAGWPVVITAAPDAGEAALVARLKALLTVPVHDFSGRFNLKELAALAGRARLFLGVDSAPMHIAAAMGTPVVALFGPSGDLEWGPWGEPRTGAHQVVASDRHPCRPCGLDGCGGGKVSDCLVGLGVEAVWAALVRALPESRLGDLA